jgi:uncharacterized protein (TIGR02246 family)
VPALIVLLVLSLPEPSGATACRPEAAAARAVRAVAEGIVAADNARDVERVVAHYAADAVLLPPGESPVHGRAAIRPRYEALFAAFAPAIVGRVDEVCAEGRLALVRGHNGGRLAARGGEPSRDLDDAYLMVLRREDDGHWRISHLIWHRASPPPSARVPGAGEKGAAR